MSTVASTATNTGASVTSLTITKPTGLAVGDLMVAMIMLYDTAPDIVDTLSGWTFERKQTCTNGIINVQHKVATAGDVAASNFTFNFSSTATNCGGIIYRVTGQALVSPITSASDNFNTAPGSTFSLISNLTPQVANSLILVGFSSNESPTVQSLQDYFVTGATVSFTEVFESNADLGADGYNFASAHGTQTNTNAITAFGADFVGSGSHDNLTGAILYIAPRVDATGSNNLVTTTSTTFVQAGIADGVAGNTLATASTQSFTQGGQGTSPTQWSNETKPSTTWSNPDK